MTSASLEELIQRCGLTRAVLDGDGQPQLGGDEQLEVTFDDVAMVSHGQQDMGVGKLFFTSRNIVWTRNKAAAVITYREISMHAISHDTTFHPQACIYCQLDDPESLSNAQDADDCVSREILLVPSDPSAVDALFAALCKGAEANPDDMDEDEGEFFYDQAEVQNGLDAAGMANLADFEQRLQLQAVPEPQTHESDQTNGDTHVGSGTEGSA